MPISIPVPQLQIDFAFALEQIRGLYLQHALSEAVGKLDIKNIDAELARIVPSASLTQLATRGLRGELMFAVPGLLSSAPRLLGYYRLLLGFSQKAFYTTEFGLTGFKSMEEKGALTAAQSKRLDELCPALVGSAAALLDGIGVERITRQLLEDLALLTVGPQLRGGHNVKLGLAGIVRVFDAISSIVAHAAVTTEPICIELKNAAGRCVLIEFFSDPDIVIREEMAPGAYRNIIAIEIKGGMDFSNIHNRIGEAEKSHQKARANGFHECWTVVNVDRIDLEMGRRESPSTNRFYRLSQIDGKLGDEYVDFRNRVISLTGISSP
ncbi:MAG: XcyI family restriction endonuclease [Gammaproteobacteria bacterium]